MSVKVDIRKTICMADLLFMKSIQCKVYVKGCLDCIPIIMKNSPVTVLQPERFMGVLLPYLRGLLSNDIRVTFEGSRVLV